MRSAPRLALLPLAAAVLSLVLAGGTLVAAPTASATTTREARLVAMINHARVRHGLAPLHLRAGLVRYARRHSRSMAAQGDLFHTANFSVICCWSMVGENIGYNSTVRRMHRAFMASPGHRANVLERRYRQVGVGIVKKGDRLWVTEIFRRPS